MPCFCHIPTCLFKILWMSLIDYWNYLRDHRVCFAIFVALIEKFYFMKQFFWRMGLVRAFVVGGLGKIVQGRHWFLVVCIIKNEFRWMRLNCLWMEDKVNLESLVWWINGELSRSDIIIAIPSCLANFGIVDYHNHHMEPMVNSGISFEGARLKNIVGFCGQT